MPRKIDKRIKRTKKLLRDGLTELMAEKPIKEITVKELSEKVDINRGTFYLHHRDVYELLESIEQELMDELLDVFSKHSTEDLSGKPFPLLKDIFTILKNNADISTVLLGPNGDISFIVRIKEIIRSRCLHEWMTFYQNSDPIRYQFFYSFVVEGCIGLFKTWLEGGMKETTEEMAEMAENIILHGINFLKD